MSVRSCRDFQKAGNEKPSAIQTNYFRQANCCVQNNIITPAKINDNHSKYNYFEESSQNHLLAIGISILFSCHTRAIFYNIAFNIVIAKERSMFHYRASALLNLASYLIFSFRFRTYVLTFQSILYGHGQSVYSISHRISKLCGK